MAQAERPLSPHLQIYRWPINMALSIAHRMTGIGLALGLILLTWWLLALASGPEAFATVQAVMRSWLGVLVLFLWTFVLFYHLGNGVRHLVWDAGYGFEIETARQLRHRRAGLRRRDDGPDLARDRARRLRRPSAMAYQHPDRQGARPRAPRARASATGRCSG